MNIIISSLNSKQDDLSTLFTQITKLKIEKYKKKLFLPIVDPTYSTLGIFFLSLN